MVGTPVGICASRDEGSGTPTHEAQLRVSQLVSCQGSCYAFLHDTAVSAVIQVANLQLTCDPVVARFRSLLAWLFTHGPNRCGLLQ